MIGVIIVTYNRLEELKIALDRSEKQSLLPDSILIVNNASNDGTKEWLTEWKDTQSTFLKYVINLHHNLGGSGGFYFGQKIALPFFPLGFGWQMTMRILPLMHLKQLKISFLL